MKQEKCDVCDGLIKPAIRRMPFHYKRATIYVDNVPVRRCKRCGDVYFEATVYKRLEKIAENKHQIQKRISFPLADYRLT